MIEPLLHAERALAMGLLDQAETIYRQTIEHDPRSSIAIVGLARVALERGDERAAYQLGLHALEVDGENAAAQRLVARLDEVMRHRGETPPPASAPVAPPPSAGLAPAAPSAAASRAKQPPQRKRQTGFLAKLFRRR